MNKKILVAIIAVVILLLVGSMVSRVVNPFALFAKYPPQQTVVGDYNYESVDGWNIFIHWEKDIPMSEWDYFSGTDDAREESVANPMVIEYLNKPLMITLNSLGQFYFNPWTKTVVMSGEIHSWRFGDSTDNTQIEILFNDTGTDGIYLNTGGNLILKDNTILTPTP